MARIQRDPQRSTIILATVVVKGGKGRQAVAFNVGSEDIEKAKKELAAAADADGNMLCLSEIPIWTGDAVASYREVVGRLVTKHVVAKQSAA